MLLLATILFILSTFLILLAVVLLILALVMVMLPLATVVLLFIEMVVCHFACFTSNCSVLASSAGLSCHSAPSVRFSCGSNIKWFFRMNLGSLRCFKGSKFP